MSDNTPTGKAYEAPGITVYFDGEICQHSERCISGLPEVFDTSRRPWITATGADAETIAAQIRRCPSGALQYVLHDEGA